ncbi:MAG: hypothetical protein OHK0032_11460 [Thermodesulfovibrionales bacterium]
MDRNRGHIDLKVDGLTCTGCAMDLETFLNNIDGILKAAVDYAEEKIHIEYDPDEIGESQIVSAVRRIGFKVVLMSP